MAKPTKKPKRKAHPDLNELAASVVAQATDKSDPAEAREDGKNPAAVALGRLGGLKEGKARAEKRSEIARTAAKARRT